MKQLLLLISCTYILAQANAQAQEKSFFVTASGGATIQKENESNNSKSLLISTSINYLLNNRWSFGLAAEHSRATAQSGQRSVPMSGGSGYTSFYSSFETKLQTWFLGPQARYYHPINSRLSVFGETQAGLYFESAEVESNSKSYYYGPSSYYDPYGTPTAISNSQSEADAISVRAVASPGIVYFIKPRFGLELKTSILQYYHGLEDSKLPEGAEQAKSFDVDFSLANSKFGLSFYF